MTGLLLLLLAAAPAAPQRRTASEAPVELTVSESGGRLTYSLANRTPWRITRYQVMTDFPTAGLGCGFTAEVRKAEDLVRKNVCSIPLDKNGKPVPYASRIEFVRFDNGMTWQPPDKN